MSLQSRVTEGTAREALIALVVTFSVIASSATSDTEQKQQHEQKRLAIGNKIRQLQAELG